jgi:hypothetical protein
MKALRARAAPSLMLVLFTMFAALWTPASRGVAQSSLAGTYTPSPRRVDVQIVTWGEDCGARPKSAVIPENGDVVVSVQGAQLALKFPDRTLTTNGCWSPNPNLKLLSTTSGNGRYEATCKTPSSDAKRETGKYIVLATERDALQLTEQSEYDWQLKASHCIAKVKSAQTLTSASAGSTPVAVPTATEPLACVPSAPTRLRLRPSDANIAPGERVCFTVRATDPNNCPVPLDAGAVELSLSRPSGAQGSLSGGCFRAAGNAAQAEGVFKVIASGFGARSEASVVVSAPDLSDITARRGPSSGSVLTNGARSEESALESSVRAVATGSHGTLWLGVGIALLGGALSLAAIVALRLARKQMIAAEASAPSAANAHPRAPAPTNVSPKTPPPAPKLSDGPQRICPRCRRGYLPGTERCESDGEALLDYDAFVKQSAAKAAEHCPKCGHPLAAEAVFCGHCGHKLAS